MQTTGDCSVRSDGEEGHRKRILKAVYHSHILKMVDIHQDPDNLLPFRRVLDAVTLRTGFFSSVASPPFAEPFIESFMVWTWCWANGGLEGGELQRAQGRECNDDCAEKFGDMCR